MQYCAVGVWILIGLVGVATAGCTDNDAFLDEQGKPCIHWVGRDCTEAWLTGLSAEGQEELIEECPNSCGVDCVTAEIPNVRNPFSHSWHSMSTNAPFAVSHHNAAPTAPRPVIAVLHKHQPHTGCSGESDILSNYTAVHHIDEFTSCFSSTAGSETWACGLGEYSGTVTISRHSGLHCRPGVRLDGSQKADGTQLAQWRHSVSDIGPVMCNECSAVGSMHWKFVTVSTQFDRSVLPMCIRNVCDRCDGPNPAMKCHAAGIIVGCFIGILVLVFLRLRRYTHLRHRAPKDAMLLKVEEADNADTNENVNTIAIAAVPAIKCTAPDTLPVTHAVVAPMDAEEPPIVEESPMLPAASN